MTAAVALLKCARLLVRTESDAVGRLTRRRRGRILDGEIEVEDVGPVTARERPDVALVGLGESSEHALTLIERIVREAACPVIVLIHAPDPMFVREASKRGVFAYIVDGAAEDWQSSIDIGTGVRMVPARWVRSVEAC